MADDGRSVFVTVGTLDFDELIRVMTTEEVKQVLKNLGYNKLVLQIGCGSYEPESGTSREGLQVEAFRYKDSIADDMQNASLIISHAGAGSVLEALGANKPLVVVINQLLMGNHQMEVAVALAKDGHLLYTTCGDLPEMLKSMDIKKLKPFPPGSPETFGAFMNEIMGLT